MFMNTQGWNLQWNLNIDLICISSFGYLEEMSSISNVSRTVEY